MKTVALNNGIEIPVLGLGTSQMKTPEETIAVIKDALAVGYRLIDTAKMYGNEEPVGRGIRESGVSREEIIVTTKLWPDDFNDPEGAFKGSLERLGLDYVDIYLVHWPHGFEPRVWKSLEALQKQGLIKTLGISNFTIEMTEDLLGYAEIPPAINQVQWNPFSHDLALLDYSKGKGIHLEGYRPLTRGEHTESPEVDALMKKYGKTFSQILIRWSLDHGVITIPKTTKHERLVENMDVFDFALTPEEIASLDALAS